MKMAKFYGTIGFASDVHSDVPGVYIEDIVERPYFGNLVRNTRRLQETDKVNDDINIANEISIVADPYAMENIYQMRYVTFMGTKWKVTNVEVKYPRLLLSIGGIYNAGPTETTSNS